MSIYSKAVSFRDPVSITVTVHVAVVGRPASIKENYVKYFKDKMYNDINI